MAGNPYLWSTTAGSNQGIDADVNVTEGQTPGTVNDSMRGMMAAVAGYIKDTGGTITTGGTATAYTATSNIAYAGLNTGTEIGIIAHATNTGAATFNLNSQGAKSIRVITAAGEIPLVAGMMKLNGAYILRYGSSYNTGNGGWVLLNPVCAPATSQTFLSGSGTYTTPANATRIEIHLVGGGGGGAGSGTSGGVGGAGGNTTFSTLTGTGGGAGSSSSAAVVAGGAAAGGIINQVGGSANGADGTVPNRGSAGGCSFYGGFGPAGAVGGAGVAAISNSGSGGGGGGGNTTANCGGGGSAGGYVLHIIPSPAATYSYAVGAGGSAGSAGTGGFAGGAGGSGRITVLEYYT